MKQKLIEALQSGRKTKQELIDELHISDRKLRELRSQINSDRSKQFEKVFIKAYSDGGYSIGDDEDIEQELRVIGSRLNRYYQIIAKLSAITSVKKQEHIF